MTDYTTLNDKTSQVLKVTAEGEFIWHEDADRLIEEGDYTGIPAMKHILKALRQALAQDHGFDRTASHMADEYVDTNWDTSDMAHRAGGLSVDLGTDRGAWSDVPDATKWVDELRGDDEPEQEPVAWMYEIFGDRVLTTNPKKIDLVIANGKTVTPLYTAPSSKPWVSLTDEELYDVAEESEFGYTNLARAIEAKLREKNT